MFSINSSNELKLRQLNLYSEINITINGTGNQEILSDDFNSLPDEILINNNIQKEKDRIVYNLQN